MEKYIGKDVKIDLKKSYAFKSNRLDSILKKRLLNYKNITNSNNNTIDSNSSGSDGYINDHTSNVKKNYLERNSLVKFQNIQKIKKEQEAKDIKKKERNTKQNFKNFLDETFTIEISNFIDPLDYVQNVFPFNPEWNEILRPVALKLARITWLLKSSPDFNTFVPKPDRVFHALSFFKPSETVGFLIGQDPYHIKNKADGLAFSVNENCYRKQKDSLSNIFICIKNDFEESKNYIWPPKSGSLEAWAKQKILLLNTILTTKIGKPLAHENLGWQEITNAIIKNVSDITTQCVFLLFGHKAEKKIHIINKRNRHAFIATLHPSPISALGNKGGKNFFDSHPFYHCNQQLIHFNKKPINWLAVSEKITV